MENPSRYSSCSIIDAVSPLSGWMTCILSKWRKWVKFFAGASFCIGTHTNAQKIEPFTRLLTQFRWLFMHLFMLICYALIIYANSKVSCPEEKWADVNLLLRQNSLANPFSVVWHLQNFSVKSFPWTCLQSLANLAEIAGNFSNNRNDSNFDFRNIFDECYPGFFFIHPPWFMTSTSATTRKLFLSPILFIRSFLAFFPLLLPASKFTTWTCSYESRFRQNCHCP